MSATALTGSSTHSATAVKEELLDESARVVQKAFEDCKSFLYYLDSGKGFEACEAYCVDGGATFESQCETLADIKTVRDYALWMQELVTQAFQGGFSRKVHNVSYCEETNTVAYIATLIAKGNNDADGTDIKEMKTDYAYLVKLDANDGKVESVRKIWNDFYSLRKAGWLQKAQKSEEGHHYD